MADKDKILANAKAWFAQQDLPNEVSKVNRLENGRAVVDPELYLVQMTCGWCGQIAATYQEEVRL